MSWAWGTSEVENTSAVETPINLQSQLCPFKVNTSCVRPGPQQTSAPLNYVSADKANVQKCGTSKYLKPISCVIAQKSFVIWWSVYHLHRINPPTECDKYEQMLHAAVLIFSHDFHMTYVQTYVVLHNHNKHHIGSIMTKDFIQMGLHISNKM